MRRPDKHEEIQRMLSAYLDGELTQADRQRVRLHLEECRECRLVMEEMAALQRLTAEMKFPDPPEEIMDALERRLSVRAPRRFGWSLLVAALVAWIGYLVYLVARHPRWPTIPEFLAGAAGAGLLLVFLSVLRQRWLERPHDRYRKVKR